MQHTSDDGGLILASEEFSPEERQKYHAFSSYEERVLRTLLTHGPVLLRGGRGSGKSALMLEADRRMTSATDFPFSVYVSLRYLPLLKKTGADYIDLVAQLIAEKVADKLGQSGFTDAKDMFNVPETNLHDRLLLLARKLNRRVVLLIDDAAHIGREASLADFFDLFRTMSSDSVSCKAAIYPGVTKFGSRFDVYNDSTVVDIARNENAPDFGRFFLDVINRRFSGLSDQFFSAGKTPDRMSAFLGRVVLGNMRAFVFACKYIAERAAQNETKIGLTDVTECMKYLASDYYWPLLDELAPKLGAYEPQIATAQQIAEVLFAEAGKDASGTITIHREHLQRLGKAFEILEYTGFLSKRDASKVILRGGRGPRYALNLANLLERVHGVQVTNDLFDRWLSNAAGAEIPVNHKGLTAVTAPKVEESGDIDILSLPVAKLRQSNAYPYGLTDYLLGLLTTSGITSVDDIARKTDNEIDDIPGIGIQYVKRIRAVVDQAVWM